MSASRNRRIGRAVAVVIAVFGLLMMPSCSSTIEMGEDHSKSSAIRISFWTEPTQPRAQQNVELHARISGAPADKAKEATVDFGYYQFVNTPEGFVTDLAANPTGPGEYVATTHFKTATDWKVGVRFWMPGENPVISFFTVGVKQPPK